MPGLDNDELLSLLESRTPATTPAKPAATGPKAQAATSGRFGPVVSPNTALANTQAERAQAIRDEIYQRHGIPSGTSPEEAVKYINQRAALDQQAGKDYAEPSAWANPEERAKARAAYAAEMNGLVPRSPQEVRQRWDESIYLMDPRTYQYMQRYGRDLDFLSDEAQWNEKREQGRSGPGRQANQGNWDARAAIQHYDDSKDLRLYRRGMGTMVPGTESGYQRFGGVGGAMLDNTSNPDLTLGTYMTASSVFPNFLRMQGSGEADTTRDSYERAQATRLAQNRYRMQSPAPVLDLPAGASQQDIAKRIRELQQEVMDAQVPMADERWQRTLGFTPPGWITDAGDFLLDMFDPTALIPAVRALKTTSNAAKATSMANRIAGAGWQKPYVRQAVASLGRDQVADAGGEMATGSAINASIGGTPGRSGLQWALGVDPQHVMKSAAQVQQGQRASDALYSRLSQEQGVSSAQREAYKSLEESGALGPLARERARMFPTRQQ